MASRVLGAFAVTVTAALATLALATPASAHVPVVKAFCDETAKKTVLSVSLTYYAGGNKNTVKITDGDKVLRDRKFSESYDEKWEDLDATVDHTFVVDVKASDNRPGKSYDHYEKVEVKACVKTPPTKPTKPTKTTKPSEPTTPEVPSSSVTPPSSSTPTAPAPGGSTPEPPLAATGASPMWLLLSGLGLVGAGAGTLLFLRRRRA
ncbi:LPXTG cell wall anchor domain-containing protein [Lentzea indica]|uniref:LPXTG cell wall anchor domain-containing protein n=1 Tax=Lentzea indica TaxID=2604800 RepID=UPI00143C41FD|nr:LPXTG cell wall anchor domain-containing protein [Lentzea indica]